MSNDIPEKKRAIDNLTYREDKEKMQKGNGIMVADITDKLTLSEIREYLKRVSEGRNTKDLLEGKDLKKIELDELQKLADKRTS